MYRRGGEQAVADQYRHGLPESIDPHFHPATESRVCWTSILKLHQGLVPAKGMPVAAVAAGRDLSASLPAVEGAIAPVDG